ncbi:mCG1037641, partial [Mus musculus]
FPGDRTPQLDQIFYHLCLNASQKPTIYFCIQVTEQPCPEKNFNNKYVDSGEDHSNSRMMLFPHRCSQHTTKSRQQGEPLRPLESGLGS